MAKRILLNNSYESWMQAVEYAKLLQDGVCTLGYKKRFVSSLHNAVELFLKQIMLDNCDYRIATIKNGISADGSPLKDFYQATDLNKYFSDLSPEIRKKFFTIEFSELIPITILTAFVVCFTMAVTVLIAKLIGCTLPMCAHRLDFDPAVMASPFITTIVDALSLLVYFNIARSLLF